jgi:phosphoglycerol transferase MdoB-like AlkP superfamily enzyme
VVPEIYLNWYAVAAVVVTHIVIGLMWYGPLFGTAWMREMDMAPDFKPDAALLKRSLLLMIVSALLTAVVLACAIEVIRPSSWQAGADAANFVYGLIAAALAWIGFYVPMLLGGVAWENRSWKLFGINAGYHLLALLVAGLILANWR